MNTRLGILVFAGMLLPVSQGIGRDRTLDTQKVDGFSPSKKGSSAKGFWKTPEGKQAAAEIWYQQAQQAYQRTLTANADMRSDAALQQYAKLMVLYTQALANFGMNTGNKNPPLPILPERVGPITDDQLKADYGVVLKDYFGGIKLFGQGVAWTRPPSPPPLPPLRNKYDAEYVSFAKALQLDDEMIDKFADRVYAAAALSRATPLPFGLRGGRPAQQEEQRWCEIDLGSSTGRVPC